ncbi:MAG: glycoside hydrolase family 9 protein [Lachnospiraceae bacterium]|nr:glycoside hydrolase family 9 protein [Lachnospiraceae bacterium]
MKSKKLISVLLVFVMTAGLLSAGACNKAENEESSSVLPSEVASEVVSEEPSEEKSNKPVVGTKIIDDNFDEEEGEPVNWRTYTNGGKYELYVENGELVADISDAGNLEYSIQAYRDGFAMVKGCEYEVEFDIRSEIDRVIEWRIQLNGGDYHAYYLETDMPIGPETTHVQRKFSMGEGSDLAPRFCFNMGFQGELDPSVAHKVYIDNIVITVSDVAQAEEIPTLDDPVSIKTNQVGYETNSDKYFVVKKDDKVTTFEIKDYKTNEVVYTGTMGEPVNSLTTGSPQRQGDFSDFKTPGIYYISIEGVEDSYPFVIGDDIYADSYKDVVRVLTLQRCGMELDTKMAGDFAHPECHMQKGIIYGTNTTIDVSGGWHDAGDYGKYVVPGAKTIADLFLTYKECEASMSDNLDIPESGNGVPDLLDEARYELEFFFKMQAANGGVYHKVTGLDFPDVVMPEEETQDLYVFPISTTATGDFAAVMAMAYDIYKPYDEAFAEKCLAASKKAYEYMDKNALNDKTGFKNPDDVNTGEYPDSNNKDEFFWASVELFLATGDTKYEDKALELANLKFNAGLGWADVGTYGMYDYLMYAKEKKVTNDLSNILTEKLNKMAENELSGLESDVFFISMRGNFPWGSNMTVANNAMLYHMIYNITGDETFEYYSVHGLDYIYGINAAGYCFVTGVGTLCPEHPHHRPSQAVGKAVPGMVVGGPNSKPEDSYAKAVLRDRLSGARYVDNDASYSTNEITIYWNSPVIYLLFQERSKYGVK